MGASTDKEIQRLGTPPAPTLSPVLYSTVLFGAAPVRMCTIEV